MRSRVDADGGLLVNKFAQLQIIQQTVEFVIWFHLLRHLPAKLLIIWDDLRSHRSH